MLLTLFGFERAGLPVEGTSELPLEDAKLPAFTFQEQISHLLSSKRSLPISTRSPADSEGIDKEKEREIVASRVPVHP